MSLRKHVALALSSGIAVLAAFMAYHGTWDWSWGTSYVGGVWLYTGIWLGRVKLGRTHAMMVTDEVRGVAAWTPLTKVLIWGGCWINALAVVLHFTT